MAIGRTVSGSQLSGQTAFVRWGVISPAEVGLEYVKGALAELPDGAMPNL